MQERLKQLEEDQHTARTNMVQHNVGIKQLQEAIQHLESKANFQKLLERFNQFSKIETI